MVPRDGHLTYNGNKGEDIVICCGSKNSSAAVSSP